MTQPIIWGEGGGYLSWLVCLSRVALQEAENLRTLYNEVIVDKQRSDQEVISLRRFLDEDRKEMSELRRQHQELLNVEVKFYFNPFSVENVYKCMTLQGGPSESMSIMYGSLLRKYETVKDDFGLLSKR